MGVGQRKQTRGGFATKGARTERLGGRAGCKNLLDKENHPKNKKAAARCGAKDVGSCSDDLEVITNEKRSGGEKTDQPKPVRCRNSNSGGDPKSKKRKEKKRMPALESTSQWGRYREKEDHVNIYYRRGGISLSRGGRGGLHLLKWENLQGKNNKLETDWDKGRKSGS